MDNKQEEKRLGFVGYETPGQDIYKNVEDYKQNKVINKKEDLKVGTKIVVLNPWSGLMEFTVDEVEGTAATAVSNSGNMYVTLSWLKTYRHVENKAAALLPWSDRHKHSGLVKEEHAWFCTCWVNTKGVCKVTFDALS